MRLDLSRRTEADLAHIRDYSAEAFGAARAIACLDATIRVVRILHKAMDVARHL